MKAENLLLVERVMKFMPLTVRPSDSVAHARAILADERISHLPVLSKGKLVGVVSARDLRPGKRCRKAHAISCALEKHPDRLRVALVMTTTVHTARPKDTLETAATLMRRERIGALPVMDGDRLRGIVNRQDIIATLADSRSTPQRNPSSPKRRPLRSF